MPEARARERNIPQEEPPADAVGSASARLEWILLGGLVVAALALRLGRLDAYPVHADEVRSLVAIQTLADGGLPLTDAGHVYWRALFAHWLMALPLGLTDRTIEAARIVPVVFSALTLAIVFVMGRSVEDRWAGVLAAAFLAASAFQDRFALFARFYMPFQFFFLCTVYFAGAYGIERRPRAGLWLLLSLLAAIGSHTLAVQALPVIALALVLGRRGDLHRSPAFWAGVVAVGIALYGALVYRPPNAHRGLLAARATLSIGELPDKWYYARLFRDFTPFAWTLLILGTAPLLAGLRRASIDRLRLFHYGAFLGSVLALSAIAPDATRRYLTHLHPLGVVLAAVALVWWTKRGIRWARGRAVAPIPRAATVGVLAVALVCAVGVENRALATAFGQRIPVVDQRPAHELLAQRLAPGDLVISLAPSVTALHLGRRADFGLREKIDRTRGRWVPFTPAEKRYYGVPIIDRPDLMERIVSRPGRVWLYANWKLFKSTSREMQEVIARHFTMVYRPADGSTGSALLLKE